ncbi:MAG: imidazolonepropionase [Actinobacteria bacterium HGW-Actinobacteria-2]|nr:MAG: imidazolonepropionase [Actinobacteria bacterium HGW-Actinobacteria-2]
MSTAIRGIGELVTWDDDQPIRHDAGLVIDDGRVAWVGASDQTPAADEVIEADGAAVIPGFVDSHTHLVFAGDRAEEFAARMAGRPYEAGGIRTTVAATRAASADELAALAGARLAELHAQGTTTVEIKSGYGLDVATEARLLEVAASLTSETTYLGAHVVPSGVEPTDYVALVTGEMLAACAPHARWIDVFCETGAFDADQARTVLQAGMAAGLKPRIHANQLGYGPGVQLACELGAAAADHCTYLSDADVSALAETGVVAGLLPGVEFSTRHPYPDARRLLQAGVRVAIATDCNPGTSYTSSMPFCIALAVREMGLTPTEALHAATQAGAWSLQRTDVGHLRLGARADLAILNAPSHLHLAYRPGVPLVARVLRASA